MFLYFSSLYMNFSVLVLIRVDLTRSISYKKQTKCLRAGSHHDSLFKAEAFIHTWDCVSARWPWQVWPLGPRRCTDSDRLSQRVRPGPRRRLASRPAGPTVCPENMHRFIKEKVIIGKKVLQVNVCMNLYLSYLYFNNELLLW